MPRRRTLYRTARSVRRRYHLELATVLAMGLASVALTVGVLQAFGPP